MSSKGLYDKQISDDKEVDIAICLTVEDHTNLALRTQLVWYDLLGLAYRYIYLLTI